MSVDPAAALADERLDEDLFAVQPSPPASSRPTARRSSAGSLGPGLADAIASADVTLAKLEAFLRSSDDSEGADPIPPPTTTSGAAACDDVSLRGELRRLRDSEDAVRRELELEGLLRPPSMSSDAPQDSIELAPEEEPLLTRDTICGHWSSSSSSSLDDELRLELEGELELNLKSSEMGLEVEDVFEVLSRCEELSALSLSMDGEDDHRQDEDEESIKMPTLPSLSADDLPALGETEHRAASFSCSSPVKQTRVSADADGFDSLPSPTGTDVSFVSSSSGAALSYSTGAKMPFCPSLSTPSLEMSLHRKSAAQEEEEDGDAAEEPFVNEEALLCPKAKAAVVECGAHPHPALAAMGWAAKFVQSKRDVSAVKAKGESGKRDGGFVAIFRWAENAAKLLFRW